MIEIFGKTQGMLQAVWTVVISGLLIKRKAGYKGENTRALGDNFPHVFMKQFGIR